MYYITSTGSKYVFCCVSELQYFSVTKEVWLHLYGIYGGGPHLTTEPPSENSVVEV